MRPDRLDPGVDVEQIVLRRRLVLGILVTAPRDWKKLRDVIERTAERFRPAPGRPAGIMVTELAVYSGDVVRRDDEGFLYFVSRKDEMIKTSGYRVSPTEIEEVVYETGLVRDAVALGVDDERLGQHIVVVVAGDSVDADGLLKDLRKRLPLYMVPKHVVVKPEIPRSPNGKFDRNLLREELTP